MFAISVCLLYFNWTYNWFIFLSLVRSRSYWIFMKAQLFYYWWIHTILLVHIIVVLFSCIWCKLIRHIRGFKSLAVTRWILLYFTIFHVCVIFIIGISHLKCLYFDTSSFSTWKFFLPILMLTSVLILHLMGLVLEVSVGTLIVMIVASAIVLDIWRVSLLTLIHNLVPILTRAFLDRLKSLVIAHILIASIITIVILALLVVRFIYLTISHTFSFNWLMLLMNWNVIFIISGIRSLLLLR